MKRSVLRPAGYAVLALTALVLIAGAKLTFRDTVDADACQDAGGRWQRAVHDCELRPGAAHGAR